MGNLKLVVLFADADAERFITGLIERGIERGCLRLRNEDWEAVRDPMHDARVAREPTAALAPFLHLPTCRFVIVVDHHGSGAEARCRESLESDMVDALLRAGITRERVAAIVFEPELEVALVPTWTRVLELLARVRREPPRAIPVSAEDPKASWGSALRAYKLKSGPALFEELAKDLSLERLKNGAALGRLSERLVDWFGTAGNA